MRDMNTGPVGAWKDGLFDCFKYGICHPHLWLACCCRSFALDQVKMRMRLNWCGEAASVSAAAKTFETVTQIFGLYFLLAFSLQHLSLAICEKCNHDTYNGTTGINYLYPVWCFLRMVPMILYCLFGKPASVSAASIALEIISVIYLLLLSFLPLLSLPTICAKSYNDTYNDTNNDTYNDTYNGTTAATVLPVGCYVVYYIRQILGYTICFSFGIAAVAAVRTRRAIREKHAIPEQTCVGCEDVVCVACCGCCTVVQMSRHTADYDKYPAHCCTETGLPSHVDAMS
jgi:hypothetical protein